MTEIMVARARSAPRCSFGVMRSKPWKSEDIAPAARHLAVGDAEHVLGPSAAGQRRDRVAIVDAVAEIAEQH